ncbi:MAG: hypothetical protein HOE62_08150 [Alphaproteobacteria bacterium]|nr:hypothetical protein [Alphaproteobacteria bacterium]MBT4017907.1 hypothetical protein [Alphaproteobacteria bacterium]MBT7746076.1 hypothetical protein [Alphaproteobacteria bacterium]
MPDEDLRPKAAHGRPYIFSDIDQNNCGASVLPIINEIKSTTTISRDKIATSLNLHGIKMARGGELEVNGNPAIS